MDTFRTSSARTPREAPRVGGYRRGSRVRTTKAGTWFPALSAADEPAGLLLLHPAVKPAVLKAVIRRLAELRLPGVLPMLPGLVDQAGRNWLVATAAPTPTVADLLDDTAYGTPENAAALLADIAATLLEVHAEGLAHGAVGAHAVVLGPDGEPMLADWGLDEHASADGDTAAWGELAELLAQRWCADSPADAAPLARAVNAATRPGPDGGLAGALAVLSQPDQAPPAPVPTIPGPARVTAADLAPPEAQRYVAPPVESPPAESEPADPAPPRTAPKPKPKPRPRPTPTPRPTPRATPAPAPRPAPPPEPPPEFPPAATPVGLTMPLPQVPAALPAPAEPRHEERRYEPAPARHERDPLPPGTEVEPAPSGPRRSKLGRVRPALLTVLLTVILVAAVAVIIRPFDSKEPPAEPAAPLEVRGVSVAAQMKQSICVLVGNLTTNGQPGRLVYRWVGESGSQAVSSVTTAGHNYQVEIGLIWAPSSPPLHGSSVTLQILEPQPSTTSAVIPTGCI